MWGFFLNKNKPKGSLGFVVLTSSPASPAPEENGCLKCLDHNSRRAPGLLLSSHSSVPRCAQSSVKKGAGSRSGRDGAWSREVRELAEP